MEIDILTGRPRVFQKQEDLKKIEKRKLINDIESGQEVEKQLATKDGKFFLKLLEAGLARRIEQLIQNDPEAKALMNIVKALGGSTRIGRASAKRIMEMELKEQSSTPL